jgi:tetratricopeptide (TPR) repeat protein
MSEEITPQSSDPSKVVEDQNAESEVLKKYDNLFLFSCHINLFCFKSYIIYSRLGNDYFLAKKYEEAIKYYSEAIKYNPDNAILYSNRRYIFIFLFNYC